MQKELATHVKDFLWAFVFAGVVAAVLRFALGLGAATGLNDASPWGLWIAFKLGFVALAGGGFTLAALVYVFHVESFRPLLRRAILLAALGYGSFIVSLIFDLGLPWHIYMPILNWQHHSVMFEIAWCVMLYFSVLLLEIGPVVLEHDWFQHQIFRKLYHLLHTITTPLVIGGIVLSTLHQSSLGALFLVMPHRVHPLWYSPLIPVLFFVSAIAAGLMALIVEGFLAQRLFGRELDESLLQRTGRIGAFVLLLYLAVRVGDLFARGVLPGALDVSWQSMLFGAEVLVFGLLPAGLLLFRRTRLRREGLLTAALLGAGGIVSQRMSLSLFTMWRPLSASYAPSLMEIIIAFAVPAAAGLAYFLFMEHLPVAEKPAVKEAVLPASLLYQPGVLLRDEGFYPAFVRRTGAAVIVVSLTIALFPTGQAQSGKASFAPVRKSLGWESMVIDGDRDQLAVLFPHEDHQARLAEDNAPCGVCHHFNTPGDEGTGCWECHRDYHKPSLIFDHSSHLQVLGGNTACTKCHQGEHTASTAMECTTCHEAVAGNQVFGPIVPAYREIMHGTCLECHTREAEIQGNTDLAGCSTCHGQREEVRVLRNLLWLVESGAGGSASTALRTIPNTKESGVFLVQMQ